MELKAIIFDVDGTLADTEELHRQAFNKSFKEFEFDCCWSFEEYKRLLAISGGKERLKYYLLQQQLDNIPISGPQLDTLVQDLHQRKSEHYRAYLRSGDISLRPGVLRLINESKQYEVTLAIATSSSMQNLRTLINKTLSIEPEDMFTYIASSDEVSQKKPAPSVYQYILDKLNAEAHQVIAIEDTLNGHYAALNSGITTVITSHAYTAEAHFDGASLVVNHLGEPDMPSKIYKGERPGKDYEYVNMNWLDDLIKTRLI